MSASAISLPPQLRRRVLWSVAFPALTAASCASSRQPEKTDGIDEIDTASIIDIGQEALIRRWDRLQGKGGWMEEEVDDSDRYKRLLGYAAVDATIPVEDLIVLESWWSKRSPNRFWARRYTKHKEDKWNCPARC